MTEYFLMAAQTARRHSEIGCPAAVRDTRSGEPNLTLCHDATIGRKNRFRFLSVTELCALPPPAWLVKPYLDAGSLAVWFGEPGTMKSFLAIDLGLSLATGHHWQGIPVTPGPVFYIAGEGLTGMGRRIRAWEISRGISLDGVPFFVSDRPAQILDGVSARDVVQAADDLRECHGDPILIVIDTLNRNFGPGDESSTLDMGQFISTIDEKLRCRYRCAVLIVHHTGLRETNRARGSSSLRAALDWEYQMSGQGNSVRTLTNTKTKDNEPPQPLSFSPEIIKLEGMVDDDGEPMTSCILHRTEAAPRGDRRKPLTGAKGIAYEALKTTIQASGVTSVRYADWRRAAYAVGIATSTKPDTMNKAFKRAVDDLHREGLVATHEDLWWPKPDTGHGHDNDRTRPGTISRDRTTPPYRGGPCPNV